MLKRSDCRKEASLQYLRVKSPATTKRHQPRIPSAVPVRAAQKKTPMANTRRKAWEQIEDINIELAPLRNPILVAFWEQVSTRHAKVNVDYVDSELRGLIHDRAANARDMCALLKSYGEARQKIIQDASDAANLGAAVGSRVANDPRKGELGGAVLFGLIGNAVADAKLKELSDVYQPKYLASLAAESQINARQAELSKTLSRRYGVPFHQRSVTRNSIRALELNSSGKGRAEKGEFAKAIADFSEALRLYDPRDSKLIAQAYCNRGKCWIYTANYDKAISDFDEAITLDPSTAALAYSDRGQAWAAKGDGDKAIASFNEAIRLDPTNAIPYLNRGTVWGKMGGHDDEAIANFTEAIRLKLDFAEAYVSRGSGLRIKERIGQGHFGLQRSDSAEPKLRPSLRWPCWGVCKEGQLRPRDCRL